jgi:UDP:flavonoid glycosyltransferase YjiC (YdhE family)
VLFVAEAVTLAHASRPAALARSLDPRRYQIIFACADRYRSLLGDLPFPFRTIQSISPDTFMQSLAQGRPLHDASTLRRYVRDDLALLEDIRPDIVVGDLRQSLSVSARLARIPFVTILNAYWSPYGRQRYTVPEVPATRLLGVRVADWAFRRMSRFIMAGHCRPMNCVRREYGLPPIGSDLRHMYTDGDYVLYADAPEVVPTYGLPDTHRYAGPVLWSPALSPPDWWHDVPNDRPCIYVTPGSSGAAKLLPSVFEALAEEPVSLLVATAGARTSSVPTNAFTAKYLPGIEAARRSRVVVSNGGSPTSQQALSAGVPVLGIASNMDQHLSMSYVEQAGAGILLRSEHAIPANIRAAIRRLLTEPSFRAAAQGIAALCANYNPGTVLDELLSQIPHHVRTARPKRTVSPELPIAASM